MGIQCYASCISKKVKVWKLMEYWDLYDADRKSLGRVHQRGFALPQGTYHLVVSIWTVNANNEILLTLRSPAKDLFPNYWETTAGAVLAGETSKQGAARELFEETGIVVSEDELVFLETNEKKNAFVDLFIAQKDIKCTDIVLQEGETVDAKWVSVHELERIIKRGELAFPVAQRFEQVRIQFEAFLKNRSQHNS
ncbi:isopentenyldiphosphate isomerase [Sphaerochaeta pleomorpha str. Grapes]|uniref:Isopentenyldiphosphate isomerase n=1 Tax=Sphaerochaeta pleomorpha (strain ATCC BAA-1885 / DSM 22778 / Grapes) TaxID=158190 RepID=G8QSG2_SPHPG|nr:NUDIX domain-containing protein [Sphaerochaeta pleomorpha]AEV30092.1 isopentenyldiphosphate isomerase [Sphaerochaeta pleomorpha str. Grapes]